MQIKVTIEGQEYLVDIANITGQKVTAVVDGKTYEVDVEKEVKTAPQLLVPTEVEAATPVAKAPAAAETGNTLSAPLPGTIVEIKVKPGQKVKNGEVVMILEAMKMKNSIRATRDAVVAEIFVDTRAQVKHGQALLRYED